MYNGYLALGGETLAETRFELVNNGRTYQYIENWNLKVKQGSLDDVLASRSCISSIKPCDDCPPSDELFTDGEGYFLPELDPAPWYDPLIRDSERFLGVVGLEVQGAEDSTSSATWQRNLAGGGVVGPLRANARELTVRALAVAVDDCGLEVGLNWLRTQYEETLDPCVGDYLWFLDCCPDCSLANFDQTVGPCWADTYGELGPSSPPAECPVDTWWPSTYAELKNGPDLAVETEWCAWVQIYRELRLGLPQYSCGISDCLAPYLRQYQNVRVVEGPLVLNRYTLTGAGAVAELEFTLVCADPVEITPAFPVTFETLGAPAPEPVGAAVAPTAELVTVGRASAGALNGYQPNAGRAVTVESESWTRHVTFMRIGERLPPEQQAIRAYGTVEPTLIIDAFRDTGPVRVGIWEGERRLYGFTLPSLLAASKLTVDGRRRTVEARHNGVTVSISHLTSNFENTGPLRWAHDPIRYGQAYQLTVDVRDPADLQALTVAMNASVRSAA